MGCLNSKNSPEEVVVMVPASRPGSRNRQSAEMGSKEILDAQKKWMGTEASSILEKNETMEDIGKKFRMVLSKFDDNQDSVVDRDELEKGFADTGIDIEKEVFDKIFILFDSNGDGEVSYQEFTVAMLFMLYRGSADNNVDVAFKMFDTNRSGSISKSEFNDMICSIVGVRLADVLENEQWREMFSKHMESEFSSESLEFFDLVSKVEAKHKSGRMSISEAQTIRDMYITEGALKEINIPHAIRKKLDEKIEKQMTKRKSERFSVKAFAPARNEVLKLMERDSYGRFKAKMRKTGEFADTAFAGMDNLVDPTHMSLEEFHTWADRNPGVFNFLDDLKKEFASWMK